MILSSRLYVTILTTLLATLALVASCGSSTADPAPAPAGWKAYGQSVTLDERTPIAEILLQPDEFVGRTVAVEGRVTQVCAMMGCWIEVQSDDSHNIRLKVEDGVMEFPPEAVGQRAVLQGEVEKLTYTRDQFVAKAKHEAQEQGQQFDPDSIQPPFEEIRLWGSGALIQEPE